MTDNFVDEFIEDYYAECDEHLATVRRLLLQFEEHADRAPFPEQMTELNRALHTVKGLSGMVGHGDSESIAHMVEDWIKAMMGADAAITPSALTGLFEGTKLLASSVEAHRATANAPDARAFSDRLKEAQGAAAGSRSGVTPPLPKPAKGSELARAIDARADLITYTFSPTKELAARGITVETVRSRLQELGAIVQALPRMAGGGVAFEFIVSLTAGGAQPEDLAYDGITGVPYVPAEAASVALDEGAASAAAAGISGTDTPLTSSSIVRVELSRLDELMRLVGELVITRGRVDDTIAALDRRNPAVSALEDTSAQMERQLRDLREAIMHVRMVPIAEVFDRMRYAAREVARESGKQVNVTMSGQATEVDKLVVERMLEPMLHLVRNAVGHGIEAPTGRAAAGKSAAGTLNMRASTVGERIMIEIEDDGAGIDFVSVEARAKSLGLLDTGATADASNVLDIISAPGFSTRDAADMTSGRGVGMGVVRQRVRELGGAVTVTSTRGQGTRFTIQLPLTLMIVDAVMFRMDGHMMAVPQPGLLEVLQVEQADITPFENNEVMQYRESILPLFRLRSIFGMAADVTARATNHVLVIGSVENPIGIVVDRIVGQREIVVRSMKDPLVTVEGISGATELSDGTVALILDTAQLAERALQVRV